MDEKKRQYLRGLEAKATKAPWVIGGEFVIRAGRDDNTPGPLTPVVLRARANQEYRNKQIDAANAKLATEARNALIPLLDKIDAVDKAAQELMDAGDAMAQFCERFDGQVEPLELAARFEKAMDAFRKEML